MLQNSVGLLILKSGNNSYKVYSYSLFQNSFNKKKT